jgi:hypothetical protein
MSKKTLALGLALSGLAFGLTSAPAWAQSALAQQAADQEKAAQQVTTTSSTNAGTAKPAAKSSGAATAKPATTAASTPTATKPAATAPTASASTTKSATPKSAALKPAAAKKAPAKPVVYVDDGVNSGGTSTAPGASASGKPQNRDVVKAFEQSCPDVTVTDEKAKAGYDVSLEREPGSKGVKTAFGLTNVVHKTNKIEVTSKSGKEVFSESGHSTNQLVKDACAAIAIPPTKVAKN